MYTSPIHRPYVSPPSPTVRYKHDWHRNILCSLQMRGDNDDIPCILYLGAPLCLVRDVYAEIRRNLQDKVDDIRIYSENACIYRNGKTFRRVAVWIDNLHELLSLDDVLLIAHYKMQTLCWCDIKSVPLKKLLNS